MTSKWPHKLGGTYPAEVRLMILSYELGDLARGLFRYNFTGEPAYAAEAKLGMADLVTQCKVLASELGWDWHEVLTLGQEHYDETVADLVSGRREA